MVMRSRRIAVIVRCGGVIGGLAMLVATAARADSVSPLTELVDAAAQRLQVAEPVAASKWNTHSAIEDPARVQQELAKMGAEASARHVDAEYVTRVFRDQINATEALEYSRFADWKLDGDAGPREPTDLSVSRSAIDGLNQTMLNHFVTSWDLLHSPECPAQVDIARSSVISARRLNGLYQRALALATQSYCQQ